MSICKDVFENILTGKFNADDPTARTTAESNLRDIATVLEDFQCILDGKFQFHQDILKNKFLVEYTGKSLSLLSQMLVDPTLTQTICLKFDDMLRHVRPVPDQIVRAATHGVLDDETRAALRRRWVNLREMSEFMERRGLLTFDKAVPAW